MKLIMDREECEEDCKAHGVGNPSAWWPCIKCGESVEGNTPHIHVMRGESVEGICSEGCAIKAVTQ